MDGWPKLFWQAALGISCLLSVASAQPTNDHHHDLHQAYQPDIAPNPFGNIALADGKSVEKRDDKSLELRILSLGASIMSGMGSSTDNG